MQVSVLYLPFPVVWIMNKLSSWHILCQILSRELHMSLSDRNHALPSALCALQERIHEDKLDL